MVSLIQRMLLGGIFWLGGAAIAVGAQAADKVTIAPTPGWIESVVPSPVKASSDGAIDFRLLDLQSRIDDDGLHQYFHQVARVLKPEGLPVLGNFGIAWQPGVSLARVHALKIRRGAVVIDLLSGGGAFQVLRREANLEKLQMDGSLTAVMPIADLRVGDELEIAWTLDQKNPVLADQNENSQTFTSGPTFGRFSLRYNWPKTRHVAWKVGDQLPKAAAIKEASVEGFAIDRVDYAVPPLPDGAPGRFAQGHMIEVSEFADWAAVVATMLPLFDKAARLAPNSPVRSEVARIAAVSADPKVRANEALKAVQGSIRYFARTDGLGGYLPESADSVWIARSGDCKGKTVLLLAMLRELGIDAAAALVSSGNGDGLDSRLPMPAQFDHVIVRANIAGRSYWLDGTRLGDRSVDTLAVPQFKWALLIRPGSRALVPLVATDLSSAEVEWQLDLDARAGVDQPAKAHGLAIFRGEPAGSLRTVVSLISAAQRDEFMRKTWLDRHYWIKPVTTTYAYDEKSGEVRLEMTGTGEMDWNNKDGESYNNYEADKSTMGQNLTWKRPEALQGVAPIYVASRFDVFHESILLPDMGKGFRLEAIPINATVGGVHYSRSLALNGDRFEMTVVTRSREGEISYAEAVAADKTTDALANKRVFIYLPSNAASAPVKALFSARAGSPPTELRGKGSHAEVLAGAIGDDDYPKDALRAGTSGTTTVTFDVGIDGRVHNCGIDQSSGSDSLDNQSCTLLSGRFTFKPARGADGLPTTETRSQRIAWRLPDESARWVEPYDITSQYTLGANGIARDCEISGTPKPTQPTLEQCAKVGNNVAVKDEQGNPITVRVIEHSIRTVQPVGEKTVSPSSNTSVNPH